MAARCAAESAATIGMVGKTHRSDSMVSMPSPAAMTSCATPKRTALPEEMTHRPSRRVDRRLVAAPTGRARCGARR